MPGAYVAINTDLGREDFVLEKLVARYSPHVRYSGKFNGVYDILTHVYSDSEDKLKEVLGNIRHIDGVRSTLTLIVKSSEKV